jgi:hypoxanthine phosphoribosyltransferase
MLRRAVKAIFPREDRMNQPPRTNDKLEILFDPEQISRCVDRMAAALSEILPTQIVVLALLKGSFMFTADLVRALHSHGITSRIEFLTVSSYEDRTTRSGTVRVDGDIPRDLGETAVLLVDDNIDTGHTLSWVRNLVEATGAQPVVTTVLLDKPSRREVDIEADCVGFQIDDKFVVGYGIDYAQNYRDLPFIGAILKS